MNNIIQNYSSQKMIVKKRLKYPLFRYYGNVTESALELLRKEFKNTPPSLDTAKQLRLTQLPIEVNTVDDRDVVNYNQYDIQYKLPSDENTESNYIQLREEFNPVYEELAYMLNSAICRLRYATIQKDDDLTYHIDQPGKDRFSVVIDGEQIMHMKTKNGVVKQLMQPGEVWYLNSNWEHKVENIGTKQRLALLGCFEYNEK
jgi:mannose-6-phosphate isomerase-like protein (cupin superfamily)